MDVRDFYKLYTYNFSWKRKVSRKISRNGAMLRIFFNIYFEIYIQLFIFARYTSIRKKKLFHFKIFG